MAEEVKPTPRPAPEELEDVFITLTLFPAANGLDRHPGPLYLNCNEKHASLVLPV
jgi:hypothetical protein